jgi:hypothetical protein
MPVTIVPPDLVCAQMKNLQETVAGGQTNVPLNANMRLFANQFGWINMGFLNVSSDAFRAWCGCTNFLNVAGCSLRVAAAT